MPYESQAQQRYFHAAEARGEIAPSVVREFDEATKGHYDKLVERVKHKARKHALKKKLG